MSILPTVTLVAMIMVAAGGVLALVAVIRGPSLPERMVAADLLLMCVVVGLGIYVARTRDTTYLDALVVVALLGFVATTVVARFIEQRGA